MRTEWFPLVNEEGETIGKATRKECHSGRKLLHPVIHLHIFNKDGDLYLQKRSMNKDIQPGKWDTAVGGHIDYGESVEEALRREVREELGITDFTPVFIKRYIFESSIFIFAFFIPITYLVKIYYYIFFKIYSKSCLFI